MEQAFKNFLYASVELAAAASEKFEKAISELVKDGKISPEEGKKRVDDFLAKSDEKKKEFEGKFNEFKDRFKKKTEEEELEELKKKVADLEAKVGAKTKTSTTTKTAAAAK